MSSKENKDKSEIKNSEENKQTTTTKKNKEKETMEASTTHSSLRADNLFPEPYKAKLVVGESTCWVCTSWLNAIESPC